VNMSLEYEADTRVRGPQSMLSVFDSTAPLPAYFKTGPRDSRDVEQLVQT